MRVGSQTRPPAHIRAASVPLRNSRWPMGTYTACTPRSLQEWAEDTCGAGSLRDPNLPSPSPKHPLKPHGSQMGNLAESSEHRANHKAVRNKQGFVSIGHFHSKWTKAELTPTLHPTLTSVGTVKVKDWREKKDQVLEGPLRRTAGLPGCRASWASLGPGLGPSPQAPTA